MILPSCSPQGLANGDPQQMQLQLARYAVVQTRAIEFTNFTLLIRPSSQGDDRGMKTWKDQLCAPVIPANMAL